ncbi:hypothetical protein ACJMK2_007088 [Sinanodonta woodiana]|uniref:ER membrane protein complex subunit 1 n=1 Tax=Sinanodonta woodiana TaxID=1069815 RepID=A0ABD3VKJ0_SINWO
MAARDFVRGFLIFARLCFVLSLYEDQIGKFDWRQQYVGKVENLYWEQSPGLGMGKKIFVSTEKNVLAAINTHNASIAWRKVFEEGARGKVDQLLYNDDALVTVIGGRRIIRWDSTSGNLIWEFFLPGNTDKPTTATLTDKTRGGQVFVLSSEGLYGLSMSDGSQKWRVPLSDIATMNYQYVLQSEETVYVIGIHFGSHVSVMATDFEGTVISTKMVTAAWIRENTKCDIVKHTNLLCYDQETDVFYLLKATRPDKFIPTSLQDQGVTRDSPVTTDWRSSVTSLGTDSVVVRLDADHLAVLQPTDHGLLLKKDLPKFSAGLIIRLDDKDTHRDVLLAVQKVNPEELMLKGFELDTGKEIPDLNQNINFPCSHGLPVELTGILARKKDGQLVYKVIILSQDYSIQLIHKSGNVAWKREEALAYTLTVEMVDLPVSENQAKFEDEFGSQEDNILTMFTKRLKTQISQLKTFFEWKIQQLQGHRHHPLTLKKIDEDEEEEEELLRDEFNLHKMIVIATAAGKVFGMSSRTGHILWQHYLPDLSPFRSLGKDKLLLYIQRGTSHFPHPPQGVVIGRNKISGHGHLFAFNPITGQLVKDMPSGGVTLKYIVKQAFLLGEIDEQFLKGVVFLDDQDQVHTYPESIQEHLKNVLSSLYIYTCDDETGLMKGYTVFRRENKLYADQVWSINLQKKQQTITQVIPKRTNEHVHSQGRVLGDRTVLYKYLNPNVVVVITEGEETGSQAQTQKGPMNFFNLYVIDTVIGHVIFHANHRRTKGPISVVHSENWIVYSYYSDKQRRYEMASLEMYEGNEQSNATAFSSFVAPKQPFVMSLAFIFPLPISTMTTTITEKGITNKDVIIALKTGALFTLPKAFLDPRRPPTPTQETMEEGTIPYSPDLPVNTEGIINYNQTLSNIQGIYTAPAGLESTSLVLAYGLDIFHTRVEPSKMFDVLKEDFEHWIIASVLAIMFLLSFVTQKLAARKALNRAWK